LRALF